MITGYNTDVSFHGKVYHVQTEDRGSENPVLETLVYVKGQILDSLRTPYRERFAGSVDDRTLAQMLEAQHKRVIRSIRNGRYDPDAIQPFGHGIITDRSFDEVVLEFLAQQAASEKVEIQVEEMADLRPGWTGAIRVTLRTDVLARPLRGVPVRISLEAPAIEKPVRLFQGATDAKGVMLAEVTLPGSVGRGEIRIVAEAEAGPVEARMPFPRPGGR